MYAYAWYVNVYVYKKYLCMCRGERDNVEMQRGGKVGICDKKCG